MTHGNMEDIDIFNLVHVLPICHSWGSCIMHVALVSSNWSMCLPFGLGVVHMLTCVIQVHIFHVSSISHDANWATLMTLVTHKWHMNNTWRWMTWIIGIGDDKNETLMTHWHVDKHLKNLDKIWMIHVRQMDHMYHMDDTWTNGSHGGPLSTHWQQLDHMDDTLMWTTKGCYKNHKNCMDHMNAPWMNHGWHIGRMGNAWTK